MLTQLDDLVCEYLEEQYFKGDAGDKLLAALVHCSAVGSRAGRDALARTMWCLSHDLHADRRTLDAVRLRGSEQSVRRYLIHPRALREEADLPAGTRR